MWIERQIVDVLQRVARTRPTVLVTGPRQVGKTSLLRHVFPEVGFVSLDLPSEAEEADRDGQQFLERHPRPLIIDEVQYSPGVFRFLKIAIDEHRSTNGQFLLTGSQRFPLMKGIQESLAGRVQILELEPLSVTEIRRALPDASLSEIMVRGGYPELWSNRELRPAEFYRSYVSSYLERDVRGILSVESLRDFERFLRACALRSGQMLNKTELARDVGVSPPTISSWLSVLEASGQICILAPWFANKTKALVKTPKLYLCDTGLLCFLLGISNADELLRSPQLGAIWETFVFSELRKHERYGKGAAISFFRDRSGEVDFLIDRGGRIEMYEAKWSEHPSARDAASLLHAASVVGGKNVLSMNIVARPQNRFPMECGVNVVAVTDLVPR
jgi:uncharacterized protein